MNIKLKLKSLTPDEIAAATGGKLKNYNGGADAVDEICTDSRLACPGALFCAFAGERFDGHDFIADTIEAGACVILCSRLPEDIESSKKAFSAVIVEDTVAAFGALSAYYKTFSKAKTIAVTGSVGKTTTKEYIATVTAVAFKTHKTPGNFNNELGLPMTVFGLDIDDEVAVFEIGMSDFGEIESMSKLIKPDIAIITNIGTSHMASLGSRENICKAKLEIIAGMTPEGKLLMNADEPLLLEQSDKLAIKPMYIGIYSRTAEYRGTNLRLQSDNTVFDLIYSNRVVINVIIPSLGRHNVYNALFAYSVGNILGMSDDQIRRGLAAFVGEQMRQNIYPVGDITVIDDCYNASPESMRAAIEVLCATAEREGSKPAALLGDMLELGEYSKLMHDQLGQFAAQMKVQKLFCYGAMADIVAEAAIKKGIRAENVYVCPDTGDPQRMADMITSALAPGDILLVKASRAVAAENVIECLKKKAPKKRPK